MARVVIKKSREKSLERKHPWVFSGAIERIEGNPASGETVEVVNYSGGFLGWGSFSPSSQIQVRIWSFNNDETIDDQFFRNKVAAALAYRNVVIDQKETNAFRLINAESDGLPGVVVDKYGDFLICQFLSCGADRHKYEIIEALKAEVPCIGIFERSDVEVRQKEGLQLTTGVLYGVEPPQEIEIHEGGLRILVDVKQGHKTGFYLDQRDNRSEVKKYCAGKEVLNCFSYTGGFGLAALKGKAKEVINIDSSGLALSFAEKNIELNGFSAEVSKYECADVFKILRLYRDQGGVFDVIILDPPKFIEAKSHLEKGARGYKDINLLALKLLRPGGILFTFSCSGLMTPELFQKIVADAALDAHVDAKIIRRLQQATCHPISSSFPEGFYLKGLILRVS